MADVNSNQYADRVAEPVVKVSSGEFGGRVRRAVGVASVTSGNPGNGEVINLFYLPKQARIVDILVANTTGNGITAADLGDANDADGLMDGLDLDTASNNVYTARGENEGTNGYHVDTADMEKPLWELLGYASADDAADELLIRLTAATGAADATDTVVVEILYVVN